MSRAHGWLTGVIYSRGSIEFTLQIVDGGIFVVDERFQREDAFLEWPTFERGRFFIGRLLEERRTRRCVTRFVLVFLLDEE
jgi:hypothetical protein